MVPSTTAGDTRPQEVEPYEASESRQGLRLRIHGGMRLP